MSKNYNELKIYFLSLKMNSIINNIIFPHKYHKITIHPSKHSILRIEILTFPYNKIIVDIVLLIRFQNNIKCAQKKKAYLF